MSQSSSKLTHVNAAGNAHMVSITAKEASFRRARAEAWISMQPETLVLLENNQLAKGDALAVARIAGIQAAKETSRMIPLCHPLPLTHVSIELTFSPEDSKVIIGANVETHGSTGVEMEALHAASVAALTLYDMAKGVDRTLIVGGIRVLSKEGGKSGHLYSDPLAPQAP